MQIDVTINGGEETIRDGAGVKAAAALRDLAERVEVGGMVSGPLSHGGERIGRYHIGISREGGDYDPDAIHADEDEAPTGEGLMENVETEVTKVAWVRDRLTPPGRPALGHFDCPCGRTVEGITFGSPEHFECECGKTYNGSGWLVQQRPDDLSDTRYH